MLLLFFSIPLNGYFIWKFGYYLFRVKWNVLCIKMGNARKGLMILCEVFKRASSTVFICVALEKISSCFSCTSLQLYMPLQSLPHVKLWWVQLWMCVSKDQKCNTTRLLWNKRQRHFMLDTDMESRYCCCFFTFPHYHWKLLLFVIAFFSTSSEINSLKNMFCGTTCHSAQVIFELYTFPQVLVLDIICAW